MKESTKKASKAKDAKEQKLAGKAQSTEIAKKDFAPGLNENGEEDAHKMVGKTFKNIDIVLGQASFVKTINFHRTVLDEEQRETSL